MLNFITLQIVLKLGHRTIALLVNPHARQGYLFCGRVLPLVELLEPLGVWLMNYLLAESVGSYLVVDGLGELGSAVELATFGTNTLGGREDLTVAHSLKGTGGDLEVTFLLAESLGLTEDGRSFVVFVLVVETCEEVLLSGTIVS
jgi:hypothetical protein